MSTVKETERETVTAPRAVTGYDPEVRFYATRYRQGDRIVYSLDLSLAQIAGLLPAPDPAVVQPGNRRVVPSHGAAFGNYVRERQHWISPAIALRGTSEFDFDVMESIGGTEFGVISLPFLSLSDLHILDGQHRILGIHNAIRGIAVDLDKVHTTLSRLQKRKAPADPVAAEELQNKIEAAQAQEKALDVQRQRFENERIAIQLFIEDDQEAAEQMFYDTSDNALGLPTSVKVQFDTRKVINRVLKDVLTHSLLEDRVDLDSDRLGRQNPNLLSAKHVAEIIRIMAVGIEGRLGRRVEAELNEESLREISMEFFDTLSAFTQLEALENGEIDAATLRAQSMVGSPVTLRVIAGVYKELSKQGRSQAWIGDFFGELDPFLSRPATRDWVKRTGGELFFVGGLSPSARRQDIVSLTQMMVGWANERPAWLSATPKSVPA